MKQIINHPAFLPAAGVLVILLIINARILLVDGRRRRQDVLWVNHPDEARQEHERLEGLFRDFGKAYKVAHRNHEWNELGLWILADIAMSGKDDFCRRFPQVPFPNVSTAQDPFYEWLLRAEQTLERHRRKVGVGC